MRLPSFRHIVPTLILLVFEQAQTWADAPTVDLKPVRLENEFCMVEVDPSCGSLRQIVDKQGGIKLESSQFAAGSFRLLVPLADARENYIDGEDQTLSAVEKASNRLTLHWKGPLQDTRGALHALDVTISIELADRSIVFGFQLRNRTKLTVREAWYPRLGGLLNFGSPENCDQAILNPPPHNRRRLQAHFGAHTMTYPGQNMAFVEVDNPAINRGLYLGAHDEVARFKAFHFREKQDGQQRDVVFDLVHFPSVPPGGAFQGSPLVIQFHEGNWVDGGKEIYRPWFVETFGLMTPEQDWIRRHGFFQMIMVMLPEGNINYRIEQLPEIARDGLKYGVHSLQIAGWQRGGHDNGYPYYEPDPRLGTWEDMRRAVQECHELGVKVYFFVNVVVNNLDTQWYKEELKDYDYESIDGFPYAIAGWGMGTLASRMGHTTPLMVFGDASFPGIRDELVAYFKKLAEIGADGIHIDKFYPQPLNFNPRAEMSPDQAPWEGVMRLVDLISRECRAVNPDFRISFETTWDRTLQYGNATWWGGNMAAARKIFPELVETVGLYQPYDYLGMNNAVRNGYAVMVSPHHFNRTMDFETWRGLSTYIGELNRTRRLLADVFFYGEPLGAEGLKTREATLPDGIEYASYRAANGGRCGCILTNRGVRPASVTVTSIDGRAGGRVEVHRPNHDISHEMLPAEIVIEAERIAFVVEATPR